MKKLTIDLDDIMDALTVNPVAFDGLMEEAIAAVQGGAPVVIVHGSEVPINILRTVATSTSSARADRLGWEVGIPTSQPISAGN